MHKTRTELSQVLQKTFGFNQGFSNHGRFPLDRGSPGWSESVCCDFSVKIVSDVIMKINVSRHCLNFRGSIHGFPLTLSDQVNLVILCGLNEFCLGIGEK